MSVPAARSTGRPVLVLVVLALSTFTVTVMQSMVMPVLGEMAGSLHVSMATISWVLTASQLSAAVFTPLLGSLGDALGRKRILLVTLALVTLGSVLVAVSTSLAVVLVGRVLQGLGFVAVPLAIGIMRSALPAARVPSSLAILSAITGVGAGAGLVIAGLLAEAGLTAQTMFWIAGVVTLVGLVGVAVLVRIEETPRPFSVDYAGVLTLSGGLVALLLGINRGPAWGWGSAAVLGLFAAAVVLLAAWVVVERRAAQPLVDIEMMSRPVVLGTNLTAFLTGVGMFGAFVLVIQFVQTPSRFGYGFDGDALSAGLTLAPMTVGTLAAAGLVAVMIRRWGPKVPLVIGSVVAGLTFVSLLLLHTEHWHFYLASTLLGLGLGIGMGAMPTLLNSAVSPDQTSIANGMNATLRSLGGSIGNTIASTVLAATTIAGTSLPTLGAYTTAFWVSIGVMVPAVIASLVVPYRHRAHQAAGPEPAATTVAALLPEAASHRAGGIGPAVVGTVRSAGGSPVRGAAVTLTGIRGEQYGRATTTTGGDFTLPLTTGGTYTLVVAADGLAPTVAAIPVAGTPVRHDVVLAGGSSLAGTVRYGDPLAAAVGAGVTMIDGRGEVVAGRRTDEAGRFRVDGLPAGHYTLTATFAGHQPLALGVTVAADAPATLDLELPRRAAIRGRVTAASTGRPVPGAVATLVGSDGEAVSATTTDPDGGFAFHDLPDGTYTLTTAGYAPEVRTVRLEPGAVSEVRVALGTPHRHVGPRPAPVAGD